jgi:hypothetical protein
MALSEPITDEVVPSEDTHDIGARSLTSSGRAAKEENKLDKLIKANEPTDFITMKVILHEKQQEYLKCLELLLKHNPAKMRNYVNKKKDAYQWIMEKIFHLKQLVGYDPDD